MRRVGKKPKPHPGHTLTDNRHGLVVSAVVTQADGYAEREAAKAMINDARQALAGDEHITITLGADKGYVSHPGRSYGRL